MPELEVAKDHGKELSGCSDDRQEVAVEKTDGEEHEDLAESAGASDPQEVEEKGLILHNAGVGVFPKRDHLVGVNANANHQAETIIGEHTGISVGALALLLLLIHLRLVHGIHHQTTEDQTKPLELFLIALQLTQVENDQTHRDEECDAIHSIRWFVHSSYRAHNDNGDDRGALT